MRVRVHIKDKQLDVEVGAGGQSVKWLADASLCRYDSSYGVELGAPKSMRLENGTMLDMAGVIKDQVEDGDTVYLGLLRGGDNAAPSGASPASPSAAVSAGSPPK